MVYPKLDNGETFFGSGLEEIDAANEIIHDFDNIKPTHERSVEDKTITIVEDMIHDPDEGIVLVCRCEEEPERKLLVDHFVFLKQPKTAIHKNMLKDFLNNSAEVRPLEEAEEGPVRGGPPKKSRRTLFTNKTVTSIKAVSCELDGWVVQCACQEEPDVLLEVARGLFVQGPNQRAHERMLDQFERYLWEEFARFGVIGPSAA